MQHGKPFGQTFFVGGGWLPFHLALCFKSGLLPARLLSQVLANLCHNQEVTASHRFTGRRPRNAPRWTPYVAPLMERCYHQKKWWHWWKTKKVQCHRNPYEGRSDLLTFPSVMVSCKKVSCYDTRYADEHEPICLCHNRPPFLALRGENRPRHWLYEH